MLSVTFMSITVCLCVHFNFHSYTLNSVIFYNAFYFCADVFLCQVVILIGSSASAIDLSLEIGGIAKEVHIASRSVADDTYEKRAECDNIWLHSMVRVPTHVESECERAIIRKFAPKVLPPPSPKNFFSDKKRT